MSGWVAGDTVVPVLDGWVSVVIDPVLPAVPCRSQNLDLVHDDGCVVGTPDGLFLGRVTMFAPPVLRPPRVAGWRVVRRASDEDRARASELKKLEREIEVYLRGRARDLGVDLRPLKVRLPISGRKAVVYFTAEKRVDFRTLLREIGQRFHRRVEMRPLGVRDGARLSGGLGPCGRTLCCATFMDRFHSVTVRMAKRQNLSLNPTKISGLCGRLMCCLAHEVDQYPQPERKKPKRNPQ